MPTGDGSYSKDPASCNGLWDFSLSNYESLMGGLDLPLKCYGLTGLFAPAFRANWLPECDV